MTPTGKIVLDFRVTLADPGMAALRTLRLPARSVHMIERNAMALRHNWIVIFSGFFEPVFYLLEAAGLPTASLRGRSSSSGPSPTSSPAGSSRR